MITLYPSILATFSFMKKSITKNTLMLVYLISQPSGRILWEEDYDGIEQIVRLLLIDLNNCLLLSIIKISSRCSLH